MKNIFFAFLLLPALALASGLGGGSSALHGVPKNLNVTTLTATGKITGYQFYQSAGGASNSFTGAISVAGTGSTFPNLTSSGLITSGGLTTTSNGHITLGPDADFKGPLNKYLNANASYFQATSGQTFLSTIPYGATTTSGFFAVDRSDYSNNSNVTLGIDSSTGYAFINDGNAGGSHGTLPFAIQMDGSNKIVIATDGSISSNKACASGYTRISPNYCQLTGTGSGAALTASSCTTIAAPASDAKSVDYLLQLTAAAANVVGQVRYAQVVPYTSSGCSTTEGGNAQVQALEQVAYPALTVLVKSQQTIKLNVHSGNSYVLFTRDTGGNSGAYGVIVGYTD